MRKGRFKLECSNAAKYLVLGFRVQPLLLLFYELCELVAVYPVLLSDFCRMHLVVEQVVLGLAVVQALRILVRLLLLLLSLVVFGSEKLHELVEHAARVAPHVL